MDRDLARYAVLTLLGMLAISFAAATLPQTNEISGGGGTNATGEGPGLFPSANDTRDPGAVPSVPPIFVTIVRLVLVAGVLATVLAAVQNPKGTIEQAVRIVAMLLVIGVLAAIIVLLLEELFDLLTGGGGTTGFGGGDRVGLDLAASDVPGGGTVLDLPTLLFVGLLIVLIVSIAVTLRTEGTEDEPLGAIEPEDAARRIGMIAGRAADRIEDDTDATDATVDNEVYRAWQEMTAHLDVDRPESSTPAEFAAQAVDSGIDPDDVAELTDLFREVRYGDAAPTADHEQRAVAALRRIESAYADTSDE